MGKRLRKCMPPIFQLAMASNIFLETVNIRQLHGGFVSLLRFSILACSQRPKPKFKGYFKVNPNSTPFAKIRPCWRQHCCQIGQVQGHASLYFEHLILFTLKYWALPSFTQPLLTRVLASSISCRGSWFTGSFGFPLFLVGSV